VNVAARADRGAPRDSGAAIDVDGVAFAYADGTRALEPVSLRVAPGEFVAVLGPSGCGKSTLLKLIAGLLTPGAGSIRIDAAPAPLAGSKSPRIAFVFQAPTLMPWASVAANVRLPLDLAGIERRQAGQRVSESLALVGLEGFAGALPRTLSGGMQMRVSIARSLVTEPAILLMDEPFGALDEISRQALDMELLALWRSRGFSVVFVTHSIQEALLLSQRVLVMSPRPGRIVAELRVDEPYPRSAQFTVSLRFSELAQQVLQQLLRTGTSAGASQPAPEGR
jgi:NitT/TauT family transport system ATP-binding protein